MHKNVRARKITGTGPNDKTAVFGVVQRGGNVRASVVPDVHKRTLDPAVREHVEPGTSVYSDSSYAYNDLHDDYAHETVDHAVEYVRGQVHTNTIENFWSLLKRGLKGTYISVQPFHLFRYLDERVFTYNLRNLTDLGRFTTVLGRVSDRRLTYSELMGHG